MERCVFTCRQETGRSAYGLKVRKKCGGAHMFETFSLSRPCTINLASSVSERLSKGNDPELSDTNGVRKSTVSSARACWLIAIRYLNLEDTR